MSFEEIYTNHYKIIHYLLKQYHIKYNYDEFYQLLLIKLWQLSLVYDSNSSISLNSFLYTRLKFYLIDLFRREKFKPETVNIDTPIMNSSLKFSHYPQLYSWLQDVEHLLLVHEYTWLSYYVKGYKQYEIAKLMGVSTTTIKKYKSSAFNKLQTYYQVGV
ncbi:sigma-70 family RNA polymerase sigma factor [Staphylococcus sp. NRL 16/872]|uniref:sigma-70 family RNA polymerase sigma factor n=1 Tax=Staphylococcus sp. NRL 16/872 TaxID=2930131 RepID=UPI001FB4CFCD|nr:MULTISPECIES: sigma-70 family RNA polymerase sigma factor [unclassified Staphylococcus]MCJ1656080.1 sigma-70 family RNA polymerase sigma factor [Staphylococcus sp. NRL 21/187]MCJ1661865.1 sigma-70 family RNA polymerase sigma factor [Staphylococcus sp. NRL 18/288]MCJ1667894.1 sigma-70 family RNA polymerase sigma factor [Staphylococcus sp. NRL 19/737]WEN70384.1 sigma-70 family RNA polymerase sigma factor [Staphylococcus sp. NRL 16/872]